MSLQITCIPLADLSSSLDSQLPITSLSCSCILYEWLMCQQKEESLYPLPDSFKIVKISLKSMRHVKTPLIPLSPYRNPHQSGIVTILEIGKTAHRQVKRLAEHHTVLTNPVRFLDFRGQVELTKSQDQLILHLAHSAPEKGCNEKRKGKFDSSKPFLYLTSSVTVVACDSQVLGDPPGPPWVAMRVEGSFLKGSVRGSRPQTWDLPHWRIRDQEWKNKQEGSPTRSASQVPLRDTEPKLCLTFSRPGHAILGVSPFLSQVMPH